MKINNVHFMNVNVEKYLDKYKVYDYPTKQKTNNNKNNFDDILKKAIDNIEKEKIRKK